MDSTIPYISLSQFTSEYCLATFNDERKHYINYLVHAKWIWKDLFLKSMYTVKSKYVQVDFTTVPFSIPIPKDNVRIINISTEGFNGRLESFLEDDRLNDTCLPTGKECGSCGQMDDYGECINQLVPITKQVQLLGVNYVETTWQRLAPDGSLFEVREIPVINYPPENTGAPFVEKIVKERRVCNFETKSCGCIKQIPSNLTLLNTYCSCNATCQLPVDQGLNGASRGKFKVANGRIWVSGGLGKWVILSYQTNGSCNEEEIMIPEIAVNAMTFGVIWRSTVLAPNKSYNEGRARKQDYDGQVEELDQFLNPVRVEDFIHVQSLIHKWGGVNQGDTSSPFFDVPQRAAKEEAGTVTNITTINTTSASFSKVLGAGLTATVFATEHLLLNVKGATVLTPSRAVIDVYMEIRLDRTVYIESEVDLLNHILIIF